MSEISSLGAPRVVVHVGTSQDHGGLADALALEPFLAGRQPFARTIHLHRVRPDASLLPADATVTRTADVYGFKTVLSSGDGWTMRTHRSRDQTVTLTLTAATEELLARILDETTRDVVEPEPPEDEPSPSAFGTSARAAPPAVPAAWRSRRGRTSAATTPAGSASPCTGS